MWLCHEVHVPLLDKPITPCCAEDPRIERVIAQGENLVIVRGRYAKDDSSEIVGIDRDPAV